MLEWIIPIVGLVLLCFIGWFLDKLQIRKIAKLLVSRESLSSEEFGVRFFPESPSRAAIGTTVHRLLATETPLDVSRLSADDDLARMRVFAFDSQSDVAFLLKLEGTFKVKFKQEDTGHLHSIRDIVLYIERRQGASETVDKSL